MNSCRKPIQSRGRRSQYFCKIFILKSKFPRFWLISTTLARHIAVKRNNKQRFTEASCENTFCSPDRVFISVIFEYFDFALSQTHVGSKIKNWFFIFVFFISGVTVCFSGLISILPFSGAKCFQWICFTPDSEKKESWILKPESPTVLLY